MGCKSGQKRGVSPGAFLPFPRWRRLGTFLSQRALPSSASGRRAAVPAVSAVPSSVPAPLSMPALGSVYHATSSPTLVVTSEFMAAMERELLLIPDLPPLY